MSARGAASGARCGTRGRRVRAERPSRGSRSIVPRAGKKERERIKPTADTDLGTKIAWYASEAFGDVTALVKGRFGGEAGDGEESTSSANPPLTFDEAVERLRVDYERVYFVTGSMDLGLYEADCEFADPFVSFRGVSRFKKNLDNLGSFMNDVSLSIDSFEVNEAEGVVETQWKFRCRLGLPWRPNLAASGGTKHVFNEKHLMEQHVESWNIEPVVALRQLVRPGRK